MFHSLYVVRNDLLLFSDFLKLMYPEKWIKAPSNISDWAASKEYVTGNLVKYNSHLYRCVTGHTSGGSFDSSKWVDIYRYYVGDVVKYGSGLYVCTTEHTSGSSFDSSKFRLFKRSDAEKGFWNSWEDWHSIPTTRPVFASPKMRKRTVEIPGADGVLDLSDFFTGGPIYENSEGSFEFIVDNDWENWETIYQKVLNDIHGRSVLCLLEDDPRYYRQGRVTVNQWKSEAKNSKIVIDYDVEPYKYAITETDEDAYWDPIVFETDVIRDCKQIVIASSKVQYTRSYDNSTFTRDYFDFYCGRQYVTAKVHCSTSNSLSIEVRKVTKSFSGTDTETIVYASSSISAGTDKYCNLKDGHYRFYFSGSGEISIKYREGSL